MLSCVSVFLLLFFVGGSCSIALFVLCFFSFCSVFGKVALLISIYLYCVVFSFSAFVGKLFRCFFCRCSGGLLYVGLNMFYFFLAGGCCPGPSLFGGEGCTVVVFVLRVFSLLVEVALCWFLFFAYSFVVREGCFINYGLSSLVFLYWGR